jgi:hypothetical protein
MRGSRDRIQAGSRRADISFLSPDRLSGTTPIVSTGGGVMAQVDTTT